MFRDTIHDSPYYFFSLSYYNNKGYCSWKLTKVTRPVKKTREKTETLGVSMGHSDHDNNGSNISSP